MRRSRLPRRRSCRILRLRREARPKPQPAQAESAKAPDRKDADKPVKEASSKPKSDDKQFNADEISALLDKQKPSGGGAKRSTQQASLGADKDQGQKLSQDARWELWRISSAVAGPFRRGSRVRRISSP